MDIDFATNSLAKQMSSPAALNKSFGDLAKRLRLRLDVLFHADSLADVPELPPTRRHPLSRDYVGHYAVDISGNWRLIFRPNHDPLPLRADGSVDLSAVTSITVVAVVDYH